MSKNIENLAHSAEQVANYFIESSKGSFTHLKLQKLVYLANMVHLGKYNSQLVMQGFEAWDYGPVVPSLYQHLKRYGRDPVVFPINVPKAEPFSEQQQTLLDDVYETFAPLKSSDLVALTHRKEGAWDKSYCPDSNHQTIPKDYIIAEYKSLTGR